MGELRREPEGCSKRSGAAMSVSGSWLNARVGNLTGSNMWRAMSFLKNGKESEERKKYKIELLAERLTGDAVPHYVNDFMRWGSEQEPHAKAAYEAATDRMIRDCRYIPHPEIEFFGGTPDGLLEADSIIEFKCPQTTTMLKWKLAGGVPEDHQAQILAYLACTRREHAVFAAFDPRLPERQRLHIVEWTPDPAEIAAVEGAARQFLAEVDAMFQQLVTA